MTYSNRHTIQAHVCQISYIYVKNGYVMNKSVQWPNGMKNEKIAQLYPSRYILNILLYIYCIFGWL